MQPFLPHPEFDAERKMLDEASYSHFNSDRMITKKVNEKEGKEIEEAFAKLDQEIEEDKIREQKEKEQRLAEKKMAQQQ
jgi:hypothetical protein